MNNHYKVAYGILLTDHFGYSLNTTCPQCFDNVRELYEQLGNQTSPWLVVAPGVKYNQFILGVEIVIDKHMDINKIHKNWLYIIQDLPLSIMEKLDSLGEPDIHILTNAHALNMQVVD